MGAGSCSHGWTVRVGPPDGAGPEVKPRSRQRVDLSGKRLKDAAQVSALGHLVDHPAKMRKGEGDPARGSCTPTDTGGGALLQGESGRQKRVRKQAHRSQGPRRHP